MFGEPSKEIANRERIHIEMIAIRHFLDVSHPKESTMMYEYLP